MTISLIISASDILLSMLFNLLIANITTLLCFSFLFLVAFGILCNFFIIPVENENSILRPTLVIPSGVPITVANDTIEILTTCCGVYYHLLWHLVLVYLLSFLLINSLSLISAINNV